MAERARLFAFRHFRTRLLAIIVTLVLVLQALVFITATDAAHRSAVQASEDALGDHDINAEHLLSAALSPSTLIGAGAGFGLGALGEAGGSALRRLVPSATGTVAEDVVELVPRPALARLGRMEAASRIRATNDAKSRDSPGAFFAL